MIIIFEYLQFILLAISIVLFGNFIRFKYSRLPQKVILTFIPLLLIFISEPFLSLDQQQLLLLSFISISAHFFSFYGGIIAALFSFTLYSIHTTHTDFYFLIFFLIVGIFVGTFSHYLRKRKLEQNYYKKIMIKNSRLLNLYKEVNNALQQTRDLDKILYIIMKSITAGHGLDFNRAMILLLNEEKTTLNGITGIGPMNAKEGFDIWEKVSESKYKLAELINNLTTDQSVDYEIKHHVDAINITLNQKNFLSHVIKGRKPFHVKEINLHDKEQLLFAHSFNMEEFVTFPLITQNHEIGILIIDNVVSKREITHEDIDSVIPIVRQAGIAIQQAFLYSKVEKMALKDRLTNLMNLRALETTLQTLYSESLAHDLSCIMIDIDFFKHYNDTNGHILGNDVLIQLAHVMKESVREHDLPFRFGGEEFIVILPNTTIDEANQVAEKLRLDVQNTVFPKGHLQPFGYLTISLGVASTELLDNNTSDDLINAADRALYQAKSLGRNKAVVSREDEDNG